MRGIWKGVSTLTLLLYCLLQYNLTLAGTSPGEEANPAPLKPFSAVYKAKYHGIKVKATRELERLNDGTYRLRFVADSWIAKITELSLFNWQQNGQGHNQLRPIKYEYHREGLGRDRHAYLNFDWDKLQVTNNVQNKPWVMDIPQEALDKLGYQLQMRQDLSAGLQLNGYKIADGGSIKHYTFDVIGKERLNIPLGTMNTLKVERKRKNNEKRKTFIWFAPDWDYMIVRLQHWEDGKGYELDLHEATLNGIAVKGLNNPDSR